MSVKQFKEVFFMKIKTISEFLEITDKLHAKHNKLSCQVHSARCDKSMSSKCRKCTQQVKIMRTINNVERVFLGMELSEQVLTTNLFIRLCLELIKKSGKEKENN